MAQPRTDLAPPEHSRGATIFIIVFLVISGAIAIGAVTISANKILEQKEMLGDWPSVTGEVVSAEVQRITTGSGATGSSTGSVTYRPIIDRVYEVGGLEYASGQATPLGTSGSHDWAHKHTRGIQSGDAIEVNYNPAAPGESFVIREWEDSILIAALIGSCFPCFLAFLVTAGGLRKCALKWILPACASSVFAVGYAVSAGFYFGNVPRAEWSGRAQMVFAVGGALVLLSVLCTVIWRSQHMAWRRARSAR